MISDIGRLEGRDDYLICDNPEEKEGRICAVLLLYAVCDRDNGYHTVLLRVIVYLSLRDPRIFRLSLPCSIAWLHERPL